MNDLIEILRKERKEIIVMLKAAIDCRVSLIPLITWFLKEVLREQSLKDFVIIPPYEIFGGSSCAFKILSGYKQGDVPGRTLGMGPTERYFSHRYRGLYTPRLV